ncbi:MAG: DUF4214 domain-containing protein [Methylococcales bacterium]|nr:DUF4214 domain-containing protein [Methylococcales bacterium]MCK5924727.1 DUF4214 domain-containing protein [Methylococcales bacterium]
MSTEKFIEQLFQTYLGRPSQAQGKAYWVKQIDAKLLNPAEVTGGFLQSTEYIESVSPIVQLYYAAFGRAPQTKGLLFWQQQFSTGTSIEKISQEFIASDEFQAKYAHVSTKETYFNELFQNIFERSASDSGRAYWLNQFDNGLSLSDIVLGFSKSPEFKALHKAEIDITLKYYGILNTQPTQFEIDRALFKNDPVGLMTELYSSPEYKGEPAPFLIKQGTVIANGPVKGATVFVDLNNNKLLNTGEISTTTDKKGHWQFKNGSFKGDVVIFGGIDTSTSQPVKGVTTVTPNTLTTEIETKALTTSLRYTTASVPPLTENTITVTEDNTLRIFASFNQPIQHGTIPVININNGDNNLTQNASMTRVSDLTYYYDFDVPSGDFTGNVNVSTRSLTTGKIVPVQTSNTTFSVDNAPAILSSDVLLAINENIGENQAVYTAESNDSSAIYSLKDSPDRAFFNINSGTGVVTLKDNPNFEIKPSYNFTVVVSDSSGNLSQKTITLNIKDDDEIIPTIKVVSSTIENGSYRVGDVIPISIEFSEIVNVKGLPTLTLKIGDVERVVNYNSGSGTTTLTFNYKAKADDTSTDLGYISSNALKLNGAIISDSSGNKADITLPAPTAEGSLVASKDIIIDNTTPTLKNLTPSDDSSDVAIGSNIVLTFNEAIKLGKGKITLSNDNDIKRFDIKENADQFSIDDNVLTLNLNNGLEHGLTTYKVSVDAGVIVDLASNPYLGVTTTFKTGVNTNVVIFDMTSGKNSAHSDRKFKTDVDYKIYLKVDHNSANVTEPPTKWTGGENLGAGDFITFVGDGGGKVLGFHKNGVLSNGKASKLNTKIEWATAVQTDEGNASVGNAFVLKKAGVGSRSFSNAQNNVSLWTGGANLELIGKSYNTNIQQSLMQTQGLL